MIDAKEWDDYEIHVCDRPKCKWGWSWPHIPRKDWKKHADDMCPNCQGPRFVEEVIGEQKRLRPHKFYIDFGVTNVVAKFFNNPEWCKQRAKHRTTEAGSFWAGSEGRRLQNDFGIDPFGDDMFSLYDLLIDWLNPYNSVQYSVGIFGIRCDDIELRSKGKAFNMHPIGIFPPGVGNIFPYLYRTMVGLRHMALFGIHVTEALVMTDTDVGAAPDSEPLQTVSDSDGDTSAIMEGSSSGGEQSPIRMRMSACSNSSDHGSVGDTSADMETEEHGHDPSPHEEPSSKVIINTILEDLAESGHLIQLLKDHEKKPGSKVHRVLISAVLADTPARYQPQHWFLLFWCCLHLPCIMHPVSLKHAS